MYIHIQIYIYFSSINNFGLFSLSFQISYTELKTILLKYLQILALDTNLKIIFLDHQNNYGEIEA